MKTIPRVQGSKFKNGRNIVNSFLILNSLFLILSSCAPTVQLNTPEPLKVNIEMKVDVYQRQPSDIAPRSVLTEEAAKALRRREERSGEIWTMKNDGAAIENETGYLEARTLSGWDASYVNKLITEENNDRHLLYVKEAQESARALTVVEKEAGQRLRQQTYAPK